MRKRSVGELIADVVIETGNERLGRELAEAVRLAIDDARRRERVRLRTSKPTQRERVCA